MNEITTALDTIEVNAEAIRKSVEEAQAKEATAETPVEAVQPEVEAVVL